MRLIATLIAGLLSTAALSEETYVLEGDTQLNPLDIFQECDVCPEMVVLPLGTFEMGAPLEESAFLYSLWYKPKPGVPMGLAQEGPEHDVTIDIPIAMGRNEVTMGEWFACVEDGGCTHRPSPIYRARGTTLQAHGPRHPVTDVSFNDMQQYVTWLNGRIGVDAYRLPTEAEWEYAARAGTDTKFAQGDTLTREQANIGLFQFNGKGHVPVPGNRMAPVTVETLDAANPWGLRHMSGNVLERTRSCWSDRHLGLPTSSAYLEASFEVPICDRVGKGGAFGSAGDYARPANRGRAAEHVRLPRSGFRIVRELN